RLVADGHKVRILDNFSSGREENLAAIADQIEIRRGNICDFETVSEAVQNADCVFHLAALPSVPRSIKDPLASNEVNVVGQTWSDADLKINGQSVQVSQGGAFSVAITLKEGINVLTITATNRFGKVSTVKRSIVVERPKPERSVLSSKDNILKLRLQITSKSTFVFVEVDGTKVFEGLMVSESSADFEAAEKIKIRTEDAGNTKVIIDGQELILGEEGEKVEKEFTANR
ncbi:DUF4115 domain-containing protein, partial [Patescibacteria group bacterium]|nr:DUF4115 domain-containing protein [Patescibacteria group bacterium]